MRVELSRWEIANTSFHHGGPTPASSSPKRRRQQCDSLSNTENEKRITASFIEHTSLSMRSRKKMKGKKGRSRRELTSPDDEDRMPVLTVTSSHRIAVMVEGDANSNNFSATGLQESSILQFASRPSKTTAFLPLDESFGHNAKRNVLAPCPSIPAVFDAEHSRVYALQNNNTKLVSYASSNAVEGKLAASSSISVHLEHAVSSLSLIFLRRSADSNTPRSLVYGSCHDGRLFVACYHCGTDKKEELLVEYFDSTSDTRTSLVDLPRQHVGTLAYTTTLTNENPCGKRTLNDTVETDYLMMTIYQLFREECGIAIVRQNIQIAPLYGANGSTWATAIASPRHEKTEISVDLISHHENKGVPFTVSHACALGFLEANNAISVFYRATNTPSTHASQKCNGKTNTRKDSDVEQSFYTCISLRTGQGIGAPISLPATTKQAGLVGPAILAVLTTDNEILLFDTTRGAQMCSCRPLPSQNNGCYTLVTDPKKSRLAIVFLHNEKYAVASASVCADNGVNMPLLLRGPRLSLAAGLASSLTASALSSGQGLPKTFAFETSTTDCSMESVHELKAIAKGVHDESYVICFWRDIVSNFLILSLFSTGVQLLEDAYKSVCRGDKVSLEPLFLLDAYNVALKVARGMDASCASGNPQDAILSKNAKMVNGIHHQSTNKKESCLNGEKVDTKVTGNFQHDRLRFSVPQVFFDKATSVTVDILCSPSSIGRSAIRNDARVLLRRLIRTGKVSARTHLVPRHDAVKSFTFMELLRALEVSEEENNKWNSYTPFDLSNDIFSFCSDVSERQVVAVLRYTLSRALPKDIVAFCIRNNIVGEKHPFHRRSSRYSFLESKRDLSRDEEDELTVLGHKLIIAGAALLVQRATEYSKCNVSLLRDAVERELSSDETRLLVRLFLDILASPKKFLLQSKGATSCHALQYLSALCDGLHGPPSNDEDEDFGLIRSGISAEVLKTGIILSLQRTVQESQEFIGAAAAPHTSEVVVNNGKSSPNLPPYQIERLVF